MSSVNVVFQQSLEKFKARLTKKELQEFQFSSFGDVQKTVLNIQEEQGRRKEMMNLPRIQAFLEAMDQYGKIIEVFLNASSVLCFIWGPMKFLLQTASIWAESFDTLLDAYEQLAENIPLFQQYQILFKDNSHMSSILAMIYDDILEFHLCALRIFPKSAWRQIFRSMWKDFKTRFEHILKSLSRHRDLIERQATILQIQQAQADRLNILAEFGRIQNEEIKNKRLAVIDWLSPTDAKLDQESYAAMRRDYPHAGQWLLQDDKIKSWIDPANSVIPMMWMTGIPGAGKTILTSLIVEECLKLTSISTVYFYCRYQDIQRNTFINVGRSILAQIMITSNEDVLAYLHDQFLLSCLASLTSPDLCAEILDTVFKIVPQTYLVVDGIDECEPPERSKILSCFTSAIRRNTGRLRGFFISQELNDIKKPLRNYATVLKLTEDHLRADIQEYVTKWAMDIQQKFELSEETKKYIVSAVCGGAAGMFLFAKLVLTNLHSQTSQAKLYEELQPGTFPKEFKEAYSRIVVRIFQNPNDSERDAARKLLGWIVCAKRPLKWHEIQGAVSIDTEDQTIDFEGRRLRVDMKDLCGSLIDVLPGDRVQLVHGTARWYLIQEEHVKIPIEELNMATLCLRYLTFECFEAEISQEQIEAFLMDGYYAFQDYAILHWVDHLEALLPYLHMQSIAHQEDLGSAIEDFFTKFGAGETELKDIPENIQEACHPLQNSEHAQFLMFLLSHTKKTRAAEEQMSALGELGPLVLRIRSVLENLSRSASVTLEAKSKLECYYGLKWNKCPRHICFYFHEGFVDALLRDKHVDRHEKPFCCTDSSCPRSHIGFSSEKELKKHMNTYHPNTESLAWKFPKVKKPPTKHTCNVCSKEYTRAHSLRIHLRTHTNERPFSCSKCGKAFVRKHDCERHEALQSCGSRN